MFNAALMNYSRDAFPRANQSRLKAKRNKEMYLLVYLSSECMFQEDASQRFNFLDVSQTGSAALACR